MSSSKKIIFYLNIAKNDLKLNRGQSTINTQLGECKLYLNLILLSY